MKYVYCSLAAVFGLMVLACTGQSLGENEAGQDTYLEGYRPDDATPPEELDYYDGREVSEGCVYRGAVAVDHRTETSFVMQTRSALACSAEWEEVNAEKPPKTLYAVRPGDTEGIPIADLRGAEDTRILFPQGRVLVMAEYHDREKYHWFDPETLALVSTRSPQGRVAYHGTRMSPSRRYVAVADNNEVGAPIHVFDTQTLGTTIIPHDGQHIEAQWMHGTDTLIAFIFYDVWKEDGELFELNPHGHARVLAWSFADSSPLLAVEDGGVWANPLFDLRIPNATPDHFGSWGWVSVSDDDRHVALPFLDHLPEEDRARGRTAILDFETRTLDFAVPGRGIAGFSRDHKNLISWRLRDERAYLVVADVETGHVQEYGAGCGARSLRFHVARAGRHVLVDSGCGDGLQVFDLETRLWDFAAGDELHLWEYVDRSAVGGMVWMVARERLNGLDPQTSLVDSPTLDWAPSYVNHLPAREQLVLVDAYDTRLVFFDPETRTQTHDARLERTDIPTVEPRAQLVVAPNFVVEAAAPQLRDFDLGQAPGFREPVCLDCRP